MDKIQFNNEVVSMRKTVKRTKVQIINQITRQVKILRNKKGSPQQLEKNRKRCERLLGEIQAMKDWGPDDVTYAALAAHLSLRKVETEATGTPRERALFRLTQHKLFVKQLATFKDFVTPDLLQAENIQRKVQKQNESKEILRAEKERLPQAQEEIRMARKVKGKSYREIEMYKPPTPPEVSSDDEGEEEVGDDDDDDEDFFMPSKTYSQTKPGPKMAKANETCTESSTPNRRSGNRAPSSTQVKNAPLSQPDLKLERGLESEHEEDSSLKLDPSQEDVDDESKRKSGKPAVDLPYTIKKDGKNKHIPGISAPINAPVATASDARLPEAMKLAKDGGKHRSKDSSRLQGNIPAKRVNEKSKAKPKKRKLDAAVERKSESIDEKLHPSWLARKAQKQKECTFREFEGKKITFDDD